MAVTQGALAREAAAPFSGEEIGYGIRISKGWQVGIHAGRGSLIIGRHGSRVWCNLNKTLVNVELREPVHLQAVPEARVPCLFVGTPLNGTFHGRSMTSEDGVGAVYQMPAALERRTSVREVVVGLAPRAGEVTSPRTEPHVKCRRAIQGGLELAHEPTDAGVVP